MEKDHEHILKCSNDEHIGLGLSISKQIANQYSGDIDFVSRPNEGSTFFFSIEAFLADDEQRHTPLMFKNKLNNEEDDEDYSSEN